MNSNVAAERAILSGMFQYGNSVYSDIADICSPDMFSTDINCALFKCLDELLKQEGTDYKPDIASVLAISNKLNLFPVLENDRQMLRAISNFPVEKENIRKLCGTVYKLFLAKTGRQKLLIAAEKIEEITGEEPIDYILSIIENPGSEFSNELTTVKTGTLARIGATAEEYIKYLAENKREQIGISTPYPEFDAAIGGGLRKGTVNLIGARPKSGKTMTADNIGIHTSLRLGLPCLNLDTEMSKEDHIIRIAANIAGVSMNLIETGKYFDDPQTRQKVEDALLIMKEIPYTVESIAGKSFPETVSLIKRWIIKEVGLDENGHAKPCVIIYDYLKMMSSEGLSRDMKEYQVLGFQITELHNLMVQFQIPCVAFIQLNREGIDKEDTGAASGSDRLIWLCSNFSILKKKSDEEIAQDGPKLGTRKLVPLVCRHGPGVEDNDYICLDFKGELARMIEIGLRSKMLYKNSNSFKSNERGTTDGEDIQF